MWRSRGAMGVMVMPVTTPDERRRLEAAGARLGWEGDSPARALDAHLRPLYCEDWTDQKAPLDANFSTYMRLIHGGRISLAAGDPDTLLRWLLAWLRPDLLDAEATIDGLRADLRRWRCEMADMAKVYPEIITLRAERNKAEAERLRGEMAQLTDAAEALLRRLDVILEYFPHVNDGVTEQAVHNLRQTLTALKGGNMS